MEERGKLRRLRRRGSLSDTRRTDRSPDVFPTEGVQEEREKEEERLRRERAKQHQVL